MQIHNSFKIMIIEDDETIQHELSIALKNNGYDVICPCEFSGILDSIKQDMPHLILLDINLPCCDGFKLCTEIRKFSNVPIIFVTSRNTDMDELMSISSGGDHFISKPYNIPVLLARIAALLKRAYPGEQISEKMYYKDVVLDIAAGKISYKENAMELTKNELKILHYLFTNKGRIASRADIIEYLWDNEMFVDDNTLSVNITRIRNKLESIGVSGFIKTKRGQGYMI